MRSRCEVSSTRVCRERSRVNRPSVLAPLIVPYPAGGSRWRSEIDLGKPRLTDTEANGEPNMFSADLA